LQLSKLVKNAIVDRHSGHDIFNNYTVGNIPTSRGPQNSSFFSNAAQMFLTAKKGYRSLTILLYQRIQQSLDLLLSIAGSGGRRSTIPSGSGS
jgi:hypothetical protein